MLHLCRSHVAIYGRSLMIHTKDSWLAWYYYYCYY